MDADAIEQGRRRWQARYDASRKREADFTTLSGDPVEPVYGPRPGDTYDGFERIGWPGEYPYTRGLYPTGYRGRTWTIRQFAGFGNAEQTNERYRKIQDRRELEDHALDVVGQGPAVGEFQFVEEFGHRVDDEFVLAGPAAVEGGFRDPRTGSHISQRQLRPAQLHQRVPRRREDRGVRGGTARASCGARGGGAALHATTITGGSCVAVREITGVGYRAGTQCHYATTRSESSWRTYTSGRHARRGVGTRRQGRAARPAFTSLFTHARVRGRIGACSHGTCP